jgi:hypothetical protein
MDEDLIGEVSAFLSSSGFASSGAVMTDLDGTAVVERGSWTTVETEVGLALKRLRDLGLPVALNTLRSPRNVVETFGRAWAAITDDPLPLVSLNGAVSGMLVETGGGAMAFDEFDALPLTPGEVVGVGATLRALSEAGVPDPLLFHCPRDWRGGEWIWSRDRARAEAALRRYPGTSGAHACSIDELEARMLDEETCMAFLLVEQEARLPMFHAVRPGAFVTRVGVDKLAGAERLARRLSFDLAASVGAGDTPMDSFLAGCGLAVQVGPLEVGHAGRQATLRVPDPAGLGAVLRHVAGVLEAR